MNNRDTELRQKLETQQAVKSELSQVAAKQFAEIKARVGKQS